MKINQKRIEHMGQMNKNDIRTKKKKDCGNVGKQYGKRQPMRYEQLREMNKTEMNKKDNINQREMNNYQK